MSEEFNSTFLNKRTAKINESEATNGQLDNEFKENTAEFEMNENFYKNLYEKLKTLCIHDKSAKESDLKSNVIYLYFRNIGD